MLQIIVSFVEENYSNLNKLLSKAPLYKAKIRVLSFDLIALIIKYLKLNYISKKKLDSLYLHFKSANYYNKTTITVNLCLSLCYAELSASVKHTLSNRLLLANFSNSIKLIGLPVSSKTNRSVLIYKTLFITAFYRPLYFIHGHRSQYFYVTSILNTYNNLSYFIHGCFI